LLNFLVNLRCTKFLDMKQLLLMCACIFCLNNTNAQVTIRGAISDLSDGQPLIGVNIHFKGTTRGTASDADGNYSILATTTDSVLVFSYVGYLKEEVYIGTQTQIDIGLIPDFVDLDEIVVVGYGSQKKREVTGAVASADMGQLNRSHAATLTDQLIGRVAGVTVNSTGQPGRMGNIKIRGASFFGGNNPLYVIDGILTGDSPTFNPNDIESVQILKDASASAIYGNRAANGVIIITTKKGIKGKPKVSFSSRVGLQEISSRIDLTDNYGWARIINAAHDASNVPRQSKADAEFDPDLNTDWQEEVFSNNALVNDVNLSVSGGGENHSVYFSVNNFYQDGTIEGPEFNRLASRLNSEFKIGKRITVGQHLTIGNGKTTGVAGAAGFEDSDIIGPFSAAYEMLPVIPVYDTLQPSGYGIGEILQAQTWSENPIGVMEQFYNVTRDTRILGDLFLDLEVLKGFNYRFSLGLSSSFSKHKSYNEAGRLRMQTDHFSGLTEQQTTEHGIFLENRLSFAREIGKHNFSIMGTYTQQSDKGRTLGAVSVGGFDDDVNFWQISNSTGKVSAFGSEYQSGLISLLGRFTYNFAQKYFLTAIMRHDGSSKFAPENRWGTFPSVSAGWDISQEKFFKADFIRHLKLRIGYGKVGNASIGDYQYSTVIDRKAQGDDYWSAGVNYNLGPTSTSVIGATRSDNIRNRNITWEKLTETNVGIDFEAFRGKLLIYGDYFFGTMNDLLAEIPLPGSIGTRWPAFSTINAVSMTRNGWEVAVKYRKKTGEFQYSVTANLSHFSNEITELGFGLTDISTNGITTARIGYPLGKFYILDYQGIYTQAEIDDLSEDFKIAGNTPEVGDAKYRDVNGRDENGNLTGQPDGKISFDDDRIITGNPIPALEYGLNFDCSYKIFDLSIFFQGVTGRDVYNSYDAHMTSGEWGHFSNYPDYFDPYIDGSGTDPRPVWDNGHGNNLASSRYIENGAYLRLKILQLGVTIPTDRLDHLRLYLSGENLLTFTEYRGLDPEFTGSDVFTPGIDPRNYPNVRTISFGLDLTF
jgi:TonB-linked SusC/RagA family outer membrane protein